MAGAQKTLAERQEEGKLAELQQKAAADARQRLSWADAARTMKLQDRSCPFCKAPAGVHQLATEGTSGVQNHVVMAASAFEQEMLGLEDGAATQGMIFLHQTGGFEHV